MAIRARIIDGPVRTPIPPVRIISSRKLAGIETVLGGVHQASERPFAGHPPIGGQWEVLVFKAWILAKRPLPESGADQDGSGECAGEQKPQTIQVAHRYRLLPGCHSFAPAIAG